MLCKVHTYVRMYSCTYHVICDTNVFVPHGADINECEEGVDNCTQYCVNEQGSYHCACNTTEYVLLSNGWYCERELKSSSLQTMSHMSRVQFCHATVSIRNT